MRNLENSRKVIVVTGNMSSNTSNISPNKDLNYNFNELKTLVVEISNKLSCVDIKELKYLMDEIYKKLSRIDKIYKKINEMDDFSKRLDDVEQGLNIWGENHDDIKAHVASLENGNKEPFSTPQTFIQFCILEQIYAQVEIRSTDI
jgi:hypothetical protein